MESLALEIIKKLQAAGHQAVFAGGCVRDRILGITPNDFDIASSATPDVIESLFEKTIPVGKAFGVIIVVLDEHEFEVATFRSDGDSSDGRHPDSVTFSTIEEDAKRRDLSINGLFYDPVIGIIDFVGGQKDLDAHIIRLIGNPDDRIKEDRLRMLRVVRFACRFNFTIDPATFEAVKKHASEISLVSQERIAEELLKILRTRNFKRAMDLLFETGLIDILPEIKVMKGCEQPVDYHPEGDVLTHTIKALENTPENASDELLMGTLLHDVGKPPTQTFEDRIRFNRHELKGKDLATEILKRLKFSNEFSERVVSLVEHHMRFMCVKEMRIAKLKRFMGFPHFDEHLALHRADCLSSHEDLENYYFCVEKLNAYEPEEIKPPRIITGYDLINFGLKPGPIFSIIIEAVEDQQLEGTIMTREAALEYVKTLIPTLIKE
jgi:poly(A) polymerase